MNEFIELYSEVYKDLYRIAYYYMGNKTEAEDAVGDAVLRAYEKFESLREKEAFRGWIIKILVNCCKKRMKIWYRKEEELEQANLQHEPDYITGPAIQEALTVLTEEERLIIALYVFSGYKGEEISKMLNKNHNTIRSKYHRALEKLKKQLEV